MMQNGGIISVASVTLHNTGTAELPVLEADSNERRDSIAKLL
jgi:hypothetical protein